MTKKAIPAEQQQRPSAAEFERQARQRQPGVAAELFYFLLHNKKWWLTPILLALLLLGVLVMLGGTPLAPWIYTIF
jgi:hypothetical protein